MSDRFYKIIIGLRGLVSGMLAFVLYIGTATLTGMILKEFNADYSSLELVIAGVVTCGAVCLVFGFTRKTSFFRQAGMLKVKLSHFIVSIFLGLSLNTFSSILLDKIPFPSDWVEANRQSVASVNQGPVWIIVLASYIIAPLAEELIFRGLIVSISKKYWGFWVAAIVSSGFFGFAHGNILQGIYAFIIGIAIAWVYEVTGSFWCAVIMHSAYNFGNIVTFYLTDFVQETGALILSGLFTAACIVILGYDFYCDKKEERETMSFFDWFSDIKIRLAPFRKFDDFEHVKTVTMIDKLADRAFDLNSGADAGGRFGWATGHTVDNYKWRAESYLRSMEEGVMPLKGKFAEPGMSLVDHSFVVKEGKAHVFYNRGYVGYEWTDRFVDTFGHAVSEDLVNWKIEPACLTAEKGGPDCHQIWSPGIAFKDGIYYMYYTGVNINVAQCICVATSADLYNWKKYEGNPVVKPGPWYDWDESRWSDCRDSMVFTDEDGKAYMYYCTSVNKKDGKKDGKKESFPAVGMAVSEDMIHWEDREYFIPENCPHCPESPFVIKHGGRYYLFYTKVGKGTAYAVSDNPLTGWKDAEVILSKDESDTSTEKSINHIPSCSEVFEFKGEWYISCAERLPGCEQYLEIYHFRWNEDGTVTVGERLS